MNIVKFSSEYCEIFKNTYFQENLWTSASDVVAACFGYFDIVFWTFIYLLFIFKLTYTVKNITVKIK